MEQLAEMAVKNMEFLDDCVSMQTCLNVLQEKGVMYIDADGIMLTAEVFDRLFPGMEWKEPQPREDGTLGTGWLSKRATYRGVLFYALQT